MNKECYSFKKEAYYFDEEAYALKREAYAFNKEAYHLIGKNDVGERFLSLSFSYENEHFQLDVSLDKF